MENAPTFNPKSCFKIPKPELQIREIPDPEKPIGDPASFYGYHIPSNFVPMFGS